MIEIKKLTAGYGKTQVLKSVELELEKGKIIGIIGPNGSGKSTLLKALVGLADITEGEIMVDGESLDGYSSRELAQKISYLPQSKQIPRMTVGQLVLHGRFPYLSYPRRYSKRDIEIASSAMDEAGISDLRDKYIHQLSGGQRQKAYIAMTIAQQTETVLLDEPTTYLDISHQLLLCDMVRELSDKGKTVAVVLHDLSLAFRLCDMLAVISEGRVVAKGRPEEILDSGTVEEVFGVSMERTVINGKTQYIYDI